MFVIKSLKPYIEKKICFTLMLSLFCGFSNDYDKYIDNILNIIFKPVILTTAFNLFFVPFYISNGIHNFMWLV